MTATEAAESKDVADGPDPLRVATAEMADGETLVWADRASPSGARRRVLPISLLGWLFLLLAFVWVFKAAIASLWLLMMGLPFVIASAALAFLPWWWPRITRHTIYAISDRRLMIIQTWLRRKVTSYGPEEIDVVERRDYRDGIGDLIFRHEEHRKLGHHHDPKGKRRLSERPVGFFGVPEVRRLEQAVWALKERRQIRPVGGGANPLDAKTPKQLSKTDGPPKSDPTEPQIT